LKSGADTELGGLMTKNHRVEESFWNTESSLILLLPLLLLFHAVQSWWNS